MSGTTRLSQRLAYWSAILTGLLFLYWGGGTELFSESVLGPLTATWSERLVMDLSRWGEQIVAAMSQHVWLPAVGVLLLVVGLFPTLSQQVRRNRLAQISVGIVGLGVIGVGGIILGLPTSNLGRIMYLAPLFVAGMLLVGLVLPD